MCSSDLRICPVPASFDELAYTGVDSQLPTCESLNDGQIIDISVCTVHVKNIFFLKPLGGPRPPWPPPLRTPLLLVCILFYIVLRK